MPSFGADMEAGTLIEWQVNVGDRVKKDDVVAVIETRKGAIEMEAFGSGIIRKLLVQAGAKVPVGTPIALIDDGFTRPERGEMSPESSKPVVKKSSLQPAENPEVLSEIVHKAPGDMHNRSRIKASPLARRLAATRGVNLAQLNGSGPDAVIQAKDLDWPLSQGRAKAGIARAGAARNGLAKASTDRAGIDIAAMRGAIADAMARSKREIPHYYLETTVDLQAATDWLLDHNQGRPPESRILMGALLHRAVALALTKTPALNGFYEASGFHPVASVHLGSAISIRGGGLIAPAILNAETRSLPEMMTALMSLSTRVREGGLRGSELSKATVTVTSMGDRGVEKVLGVIYPPQVAIIGLGKPVERPWVVEGGVQVRTVLTVTLAADHRVSDGRLGAKFLMNLDKLLQKPEDL